MRLDAVAVTSRNISKSAEFYGLLGFDFPRFDTGTTHLEAITKDGEVRLMIDEHEFMKSMIGEDPKPGNISSFAVKFENRAEVDRCAERVTAAGFAVIKEPWNAFWGQRYAIVADPDGYKVDLFAPL